MSDIDTTKPDNGPEKFQGISENNQAMIQIAERLLEEEPDLSKEDWDGIEEFVIDSRYPHRKEIEGLQAENQRLRERVAELKKQLGFVDKITEALRGSNKIEEAQ